MTKEKLRKILADFFENNAVKAMWKGCIERAGGTADDAEQVIAWLQAWANKNKAGK